MNELLNGKKRSRIRAKEKALRVPRAQVDKDLTESREVMQLLRGSLAAVMGKVTGAGQGLPQEGGGWVYVPGPM